VAEDPAVGQLLGFAAAPVPDDPERQVEARAVGQLGDLSATSLLIWQGTPPADSDREAVEAFLVAGGSALFLPGRQGGGDLVAGLAWGKPLTAPAEEPWRVANWDHVNGPLADTPSGVPLSVDRLRLSRACPLVGTAAELVASLGDETPFLASSPVGKGKAWFCPTLPDREWSTLGRGTVLLPLMQRLLAEGGRRFGHIQVQDCGEPLDLRGFVAVAGAARSPNSTCAGVFRADGALLVLQRPASEDLPGNLDERVARELFGDVPLQLVQDRQGSHKAGLQSEFWWMMALMGLLFMVGEGLLTLTPPRAQREASQ